MLIVRRPSRAAPHAISIRILFPGRGELFCTPRHRQTRDASSFALTRQVFLPVQHQFPVEIGDSQTDESVFRILFAVEGVLSLAGSLGVDAMSANPATRLTRAGPLVSQPAHTPSHPLRVIAEPTPDNGRSPEPPCPERCASSLPRTEYGTPVFALPRAGSSSRCFLCFFSDSEVPATRSSRLHKLSVRNRLRHFHPASKPCPISSRIDYLRTSFTQFADMGMLTWYG